MINAGQVSPEFQRFWKEELGFFDRRRFKEALTKWSSRRYPDEEAIAVLVGNTTKGRIALLLTSHSLWSLSSFYGKSQPFMGELLTLARVESAHAVSIPIQSGADSGEISSTIELSGVDTRQAQLFVLFLNALVTAGLWRKPKEIAQYIDDLMRRTATSMADANIRRFMGEMGLSPSRDRK
jgi:hypothetical protein